MSTAPQPIQTQSPKWLVQAPDNKIIQFPDEFTDADVTREMTKLYPPSLTEATAAANPAVAPLPKFPDMADTDIFGRQIHTLTGKQIREKGAYESANLKPIGETLGAIATGGLSPVLKGAGVAKNILPFLGRAAASGAGMGAGALAGGAGPQEAAGVAETGAATQPAAEGLGSLLKVIAPKMAESALNITDRMRGRGRTIGQSVLSETSGVAPGTVAKQSGQAIGNLKGQMENAVHQATISGAVGSTQPAHDVLNDALSNLPRNAVTVRDKLSSLHDLLDLDKAGVPRANYSPDELLEMKRGIGLEIKSWPPEWQKLGPVQQTQQRLYGAIDGELDRLVSGNAGVNQQISSLIPAKQQATRMSQGASMGQRIAHRMAAHTGALAGSGIGGVLGYQQGGAKGAAYGSLAGLIAPEVLTTPTAQMTMARISNAAGAGATSPYVLPFLKTLAASQQVNKKTKGTQQ
jgi:hypothetical protein